MHASPTDQDMHASPCPARAGERRGGVGRERRGGVGRETLMVTLCGASTRPWKSSSRSKYLIDYTHRARYAQRGKGGGGDGVKEGSKTPKD